MIGGPTPLHLVEAPSRGHGKGLLAEVAAIIACGREAEVMAPAGDSDELKKRVTAHLVAASPMILLDNLVELRAPSLAAVLTATTWSGRILGESRMVRLPNRATWVATGNNARQSPAPLACSSEPATSRCQEWLRSPDSRGEASH